MINNLIGFLDLEILVSVSLFSTSSCKAASNVSSSISSSIFFDVDGNVSSFLIWVIGKPIVVSFNCLANLNSSSSCFIFELDIVLVTVGRIANFSKISVLSICAVGRLSSINAEIFTGISDFGSFIFVSFFSTGFGFFF